MYGNTVGLSHYAICIIWYAICITQYASSVIRNATCKKGERRSTITYLSSSRLTGRPPHQDLPVGLLFLVCKCAYMSLSYGEGGSLPEKAPEWAISASKRIKEKMEKYGSRTTALPPDGVKRVLLHSCCAPCSGAMVEEMCSSDLIDEVVVFFYNPNIHPKREYEIRKVRLVFPYTL